MAEAFHSDFDSGSPDHWDSVEEACDAYVELVRAGDEPSIKDFAARFPDLQEEIEEVLPTIMLLEQARHQNLGKRRDGRVVRGPESFDSLGDYRILGELGRGGMGIVYQAYQESLDRVVALKVLPRQSMTDQQVQKFYEEATIVARLHHSNIVPIFTIGEDQGVCFYSMELLTGRALDHFIETSQPVGVERQPRLETARPKIRPGRHRSMLPTMPGRFTQERRNRPVEARAAGLSGAHPLFAAAADELTIGMTVDQVIEVGLQISSALHYAHEQGVIHRDVKPSNLILADDGRLWLTDFGLATLSASGNHRVAQGNVSGTLRYVAPERLKAAPEAVTGDIYSLGISLIELLCGRPAFAAARPVELSEQIARNELLPIESPHGPIPRDLKAILQKATSLDPKQRYATAEAMHNDLMRLAHNESVNANPIGLAQRTWRWCKKNRALAGALSLIALLMVAITAVLMFSYIRSQELLRTAEQERSNANNAASVAYRAMDKIFQQLDTGAGLGNPVDADQTPTIDNQRATDLLKQLTSFYEQLAHLDAENVPARIDPVAARRRVGQLHLKLGNYQDAILSYRSALLRFNMRVRREGNEDLPLTIIQRAQIINEIGIAQRISGENELARTDFRRARDLITEWLQAHPDSLAVNIELARTHYLIAFQPRPGMGPNSYPPVLDDGLRFETEPNEENTQRTTESLTAAIELLESRLPEGLSLTTLASATDLSIVDARTQELLPDLLHLLALCYREMAADRWSQRDEAAQDQHQRSLTLLRRLRQKYPYEADYHFDMVRTLAEVDVFDPHLTVDHLVAVRANLEEAIPIAEQLVREYPNVASYQNELVHAHFKLGEIASRLLNHQGTPIATGSPNPAVEEVRLLVDRSYRQAYRLQAKLTRQSPPSNAYQVWTALFALKVAELDLEQGRLDRKNQLIAQATTLLQTLPANIQAMPEVEPIFKRTRKLSIASLSDPPFPHP